MALDPNELFQSKPGKGSGLRAESYETLPKTFASGTGVIPNLALVAYNTNTGFWQPFDGQVDQVDVLRSHATTPATAGNFTLTVTNPVTAVQETTGNIAFNATPAAVQAALEALDNVTVGDVLVASTAGTDLGDAATRFEVTWQGEYGGQAVTVAITTAGLTGNAHTINGAGANNVAGGTDATNNADQMKGLAWGEVTLSATGEVVSQVMLRGIVHADDIPVVAGHYDLVEKNKALREQARDLGIDVQGLTQVR